MRQYIKKYFAKRIALCAYYFIRKKKVTVVGVTGSVGKTSCRTIVTNILQKTIKDCIIYTSPKNFNGEIGFPLSVFEIEQYQPTIFTTIRVIVYVSYKALFHQPKYDIIVLEYGIDHPGEMDQMISIVAPDIAIWTGIGDTHISQFDNIQHLADEKAKLIMSAKNIVYMCDDNPLCQSYINRVSVDNITFSYHHMHDISAKIHHITQSKLGFMSQATLLIKKKQIDLNSNIVLIHELIYAGVGCAIADIILYQLHQPLIGSALSLQFEKQGGRFSFFAGIQDSILIDSTYNASPLSMHAILQQTFDLHQKYFSSRKMMCVLGQMNELGDQTEDAHRQIAHHMHQYADYIILVGKYMHMYTKEELLSLGYPSDQIICVESSLQASIHIISVLNQHTIKWMIVFKGSEGGNYLEEAIKPLLLHPTDSIKLVRQDQRRLQYKTG